MEIVEHLKMQDTLVKVGKTFQARLVAVCYPTCHTAFECCTIDTSDLVLDSNTWHTIGQDGRAGKLLGIVTDRPYSSAVHSRS